MLKEQKSIIVEGTGAVYLRELTVEDVSDRYLRWMKDKEVMQYLEARFMDHSIDSIRQYVEDSRKDEAAVFFGIFLKENDSHIGNIKLHRIHKDHQSAEVSLMIGESSCWGKGYGKEAITLITSFAFQKLGLRKLTAECYAPNVGSRRAFEKAGYAVEGTKRQQYLCHGKYVDGIVLGILKQS